MKISPEVKIGFMTFFAVLILGFLIAKAGKLTLFKEYDIYETEFINVKGLSIDSDVLLEGVKIGKVDNFIIGSQSIRVIMKIKKDTPIKEDSQTKIVMTNLLSGKSVEISMGSPKAKQLQPNSFIPSIPSIDLTDSIMSIGKTAQEAKKLIADFRENQNRFFRPLIEIVEQNKGKLNTLIDDISSISGSAEGFFTSAEELFEGLNNPEGTVYKLFNDKEIYDNLRKVSEDVRAFVTDNKESLSASLQALSGISHEIAGVGPVFKEILTKINSGDGTIAKFINDPAVYNDIKKTIERIRTAIENMEDKSALATMVAVLFGLTN